jgi:hypothetical protein
MQPGIVKIDPSAAWSIGGWKHAATDMKAKNRTDFFDSIAQVIRFLRSNSAYSDTIAHLDNRSEYARSSTSSTASGGGSSKVSSSKASSSSSSSSSSSTTASGRGRGTKTTTASKGRGAAGSKAKKTQAGAGRGRGSSKAASKSKVSAAVSAYTSDPQFQQLWTGSISFKKESSPGLVSIMADGGR